LTRRTSGRSQDFLKHTAIFAEIEPWIHWGEQAALKTATKSRPTFVGTLSVLLLALCTPDHGALAFDFEDLCSIGAAYTTHLVLHEMGHQIVAQEVGAVDSKVQFFTNRGGGLYLALSTYEDIPEKSKLPYALGGERMSGFTFDYALKSYRAKPTTYNKALMFFSSFDFLAYTVISNYIKDDTSMYDPNLVRKETGCSKGLLLGLVLGKSLVNAYRVMHPEANFAPVIWLDNKSAALLLRFPF
jgi:hypothetical protein